METLLSLAGIVGALLCVGMYALVSIGRVDSERPSFFIVNGVGAALVLVGASHQFDIGDIGTLAQELIWTALSLFGAARAWLKSGDGARMAALKTWWTRTAESATPAISFR